MNHGLVFAWGPTPADPTQARILGAEEATLSARIDEEPGPFRFYCHASALPELVALVRALRRDCTFESFTETQAHLLVGPR